MSWAMFILQLLAQSIPKVRVPCFSFGRLLFYIYGAVMVTVWDGLQSPGVSSTLKARTRQ